MTRRKPLNQCPCRQPGDRGSGGVGTAIGYGAVSQITNLTCSNTAYSWANTYNVNRTYCPNNLNQYGNATSSCTPSTPNFTYDLKGNLTISGNSSYSYDWLNRLISAPVEGNAASLAYDPLGRLVSYTPSATTNFLYAGSSLVEESTSGTVLSRYVPGPNPDETVVWFQGADLSNPRYLQADERGSIVAVSDGGGGNLVINTYDEFGIPGPNNAGRFGYTGQMWLSEIGLYDYKARIYSPTLGRFMQTDPIGYGDGLNMYNYAHGDPVNGSDPFGLADCLDGISNCTTDIENTVTSIVQSQNTAGYYGTLYASSTQTGSEVSTSFGGSYGDSGFVNYNNYGTPGALPTIYGTYQAAAAQPQSGPCGSHPILGAIGKVWNSANTLLGLAAAGASYAAGKFEGTNPSFHFGNNSIQLLNSPWNVGNRAYTLGNVQVYGLGDGPSRGQISYSGAFVNTGLHEEGHTVQGQILGPLYLPAWGLGRLFGGDSAGNPMEAGADKYGLGKSCSGF